MPRDDPDPAATEACETPKEIRPEREGGAPKSYWDQVDKTFVDQTRAQVSLWGGRDLVVDIKTKIKRNRKDIEPGTLWKMHYRVGFQLSSAERTSTLSQSS